MPFCNKNEITEGGSAAAACEVEVGGGVFCSAGGGTVGRMSAAATGGDANGGAAAGGAADGWVAPGGVAAGDSTAGAVKASGFVVSAAGAGAAVWSDEAERVADGCASPRGATV